VRADRGELMTPAQLLLLTSSGALLLLASYRLQRDVFTTDDTTADWTDYLDETMASARNLLGSTPPVAGMLPSQALLDMLKRGEALRLERYRLGDGGWTIGYGRYYPDNGPLPPEHITREQAEQWFSMDVEQRGARWVRAYVRVPLTQHQFDALVHMAFNLKPSSFKTIADAVNAGDDPEAAALRYVRAGSHLEAGLRNRRAREVALYRMGLYA
jgi:lysozyme